MGLFFVDYRLLLVGVRVNTVSMSSPITGKDWVIATLGQSFCERMTNLLSLSAKMKLWFDWAFDSSGKATDDFKSMFLLPPGVIMPYYANGSEEAVKAAVEQLSGGTSADPYWRLCDGTNSTPDLRGRFVIGAGQGTGLTNRVFNSVGGSETASLTLEQMPSHSHSVAILIPGHGGEDGSREAADGGTYSAPLTNDKTVFPEGTLDNSNLPKVVCGTAGSGEGHDNIPPYTALWYIIRTSRTE